MRAGEEQQEEKQEEQKDEENERGAKGRAVLAVVKRGTGSEVASEGAGGRAQGTETTGVETGSGTIGAEGNARGAGRRVVGNPEAEEREGGGSKMGR